MGTDLVRQHLRAALMCELAAVAGKPVVLEEFGLSSDFVSPANAGHYYRQVLHTSLLAGATGWIAWNNTDYDDLLHQDPYRHHPFEMHFGITDRHGTPKPPLLELRDFARVLDRVEPSRLRAGHHTHGAGGVVLPRGRAPDDRRAGRAVRARRPRAGARRRAGGRPGARASCGSGTGSTTATRSTWCRRSRR